MKNKIYELAGRIKEEIKNRKNYYAKGEKKIAVSNLKVLFAASIAVVLLLLTFILLTPFIIKGWEPTVYHISFIPAASVFCMVISVYYIKKREHASGRTVMFLCALFMVLLTGFCILIDTAGTPNAPATFSDVAFIILPAVFIMPLRGAYSLIAVMEALYIAAIEIFKENQVGQYDIFSSIVALACSVIVSNLITHLRMRDYSIQTKYKVLSMVDALTGTLNKQSTLDTLEEYLERRTGDTNCALVLIDLDNFKGANDALGHAAGDIILQHMGSILRETFRQTDIIGRFGGDEFIVLVKDAVSEEMIRGKCASIGKRLGECTGADVGKPISCSFGAVVVTGRQGILKSVFQQADAALYEAKRGGKAKCIIHMYENYSRTDGQQT